MADLQSFTQDLKSRADIVEIIGQTVKLRKAGRNYQGLCPFHKEKSPSFNVSSERQFYHCFGCGASGDVIKFVQDNERLDFIEALRSLAGRYGMSLPELPREHREQSDEPADPRQPNGRQIIHILQLAAEHFQANLHSEAGAKAREYLQGRGIDRATIDTYAIGLALGPDTPGLKPGVSAWENLIAALQRAGIPPEALVVAGLAKINEERGSCYDLFRDRIMFPIHGEDGRIIAFSGRLYLPSDGKMGKYINSPETPVFRKSRVLYGMHIARRHMDNDHPAILCEGQLDVIACHRAGALSAVAGQGTAFTLEHCERIRRHTGRILLCFDDDGAGQKAARAGIATALQAGLIPSVIQVEGGKDPDALFQSQGPAALLAMLGRQRNFMDVLEQLALKDIGPSPEGRAAAAHQILAVLAPIPDPLLRSNLAGDTCRRLQLDPELVQQELRRLHAEFTRQNQIQVQNAAQRAQAAAAPAAQANAAPPPAQAAAAYPPVHLIRQAQLSPLEIAELELLLLSMHSESMAHHLAALMHDMALSPGEIGSALRHIIALTEAGAWRRSCDEILTNLKAPKVIERILNSPYTDKTDQATLSLACSQSLHTLRRHMLDERKRQILLEMKMPGADTAALTQEFTRLVALMNQPPPKA